VAQTPDQFAADLLASAVEAAAGTRAVMKKAAQNVKTAARRNVAESAPVENAHAQYAITYDTSVDLRNGAISAEIGYDKDLPGGRLGNLLEFGGGGDHSPPHRDLGRAMDDEAPKFEDFMFTMAKKLL
jgi:hypothetical protein